MENEILELKQDLKTRGIKGIALDIDDVLAFTFGHWAKHLSELLGNPENLSPEEFHCKYKIFQNVQYWQTKEGKSWATKKIHDNEYQDEIPLIENSNHIVNKIHVVIPIIAYITGRPESIKTGTKNWLNKYNFPNAPVIMKPAIVAHQGGNEWKAKVLSDLYPEVLGIIDDNPKLINYLPKNYTGTIFLYNHESYDGNLENFIPCPTWKDVYRNVTKLYSNAV